jgi:hypothetical protein
MEGQMFKLFSTIFGQSGRRQSSYPETLISAAIERALDGTDPRMRILPGYNKTLRDPVIHAIDHVMALVDNLPAAIPATREGREADSALAALFISASRMGEILGNDSSLGDYLRATSPVPDTVTGLLVAQRNEKHGFGYALVDDKVMNDVAQVTVSFDEHRLLDITASEEETRRLLKRRAFDYLLSIALGNVSEQRDEREKLTQQRALLRVKLDILQRGGSSFSRDMGPQDRSVLQARMDEVESQLATLGPAHEVLQRNLSIVAEVLAAAEKHLYIEQKNLRIDMHSILHSDSDTAVPAVALHDVCSSNGRSLTLRLLVIDPAQLPDRPDLAQFLKASSV